MSYNINEIIDLYQSYGFEYRTDLSQSGTLVFTISQGVFDNAIILTISGTNQEEISALALELEDLGFQVKHQKFISLKNTESTLFSGFFSVKRTKESFKKDYNSHIANIAKSFPATDAIYSYFKSPFFKDSHSFSAEDDILRHIQDEVNSQGPKLILIEAPAGFGKTCTAYEIAKIVSDQDNDHIVLFAELSRDRQAKIFNHVLHKELARSFPAVPPDLVVREIKKGKVIVVLDGFDELLNEREDEKFQFERSQAMLETIGNILEKNAKVVLTTRKTAILQGDDFDEWVGSQAEKFEFTRFSLKEPSARSWIGSDRYELLDRSRVNIKNLSNPVLLTFLRFVKDEEFEYILEQPDRIVEKYFELLLIRETKRQNLEMTPAEQSSFMKRLAQHMMNNNFTRDSKENIIEYFTENEIETIESIRSRYTADVRPTFEAMLESLSNHALLDRSSIDEKIGFINNFVLGHFVAMDLIESTGEWLADSIFVEAAVNAYSARAERSRRDIWDRLKDSLEYCSDEDRIKLELRLLDSASGDYANSSFNEIFFDTHEFFTTGSLSSCVFTQCTFSNCNFDYSRINNTLFISCTFYNCSSSGTNDSNEFISPLMDEASASSIEQAACANNEENAQANEDNEVRSFILEKFWPVGKDTVAFAHRPMFIFYRGEYSTQIITDAIESMRKEGLIVSAKRKNWVGLDLSGNNFHVIKELLGR